MSLKTWSQTFFDSKIDFESGLWPSEFLDANENRLLQEPLHTYCWPDSPVAGVEGDGVPVLE